MVTEERRRYTRGSLGDRMMEALGRSGVRGVVRWELEYLEAVCRGMQRVDRILDRLRDDYDQGN